MAYKTILTILLSLSLLFVVNCGDQKKESSASDKTSQGRSLNFTDEVTFLNTSGEQISTVRVALADDNQKRNQGLMDVNELPADAGMLFIFPDEEPRSFYMANTPLPLDIMYVNSDSVIVRIHHNTTPFSSNQLLSEEPAQFVVETNGGYAVSHDIKEGMKIRF
ncbi:MAG: hypothetical protein CL666_08040 [Balneola sp.]|nr:hypothetical protein [Balneola sp.]|tara:strand:+ start:8621 stop:9112 length:492 start_codon:yes stop_codon:yes gene_type:complete